MTEDERKFGVGVLVHCGSHGRPHMTGWCSVPNADKTLLNYQGSDIETAKQECRDRGLWLYSDEDKANG